MKSDAKLLFLARNKEFDKFVDVIKSESVVDRLVLKIAARYGDHNLIERLYYLGFDLDLPDKMGRTPLIDAVIGRNIRTFDKMIELGVNVYALDSHYNSILHYLAQWLEWKPYFTVRDYVALNLRNDDGDTPLHIAVRTVLGRRNRLVEYMIIRDMLRSGASAYIYNNRGESPLHLARGDVKLSEVLMGLY